MPAVIEPEVAGGLGEGTVLDASVHPPRVTTLVYEFEGWLGDDIVESFPCYLVTNELARALSSSDLTGFSLASASVRTTDEFSEHTPAPLPEFKWLQVTGQPAVDDLWLHSDFRLALSDRALEVFRAFNTDNAIIEPLA